MAALAASPPRWAGAWSLAAAYLDANRNGRQDAGERGAAGVTVLNESLPSVLRVASIARYSPA